MPDDDTTPSRSGGVCTPWAGLGDMRCQTYEADEAALLECLQFASDVLYDLTGRQWPGECIETIRPGAKWVPVNTGPSGWWPGDGYGVVAAPRGAWGSCTCNRSLRTGCHYQPELRLADRVVAVLEVKVDGVVVPPNEYRLDDHRYLLGLTKPDGSRRDWPCCQRDDLPDTDEHTFSVKFSRGGLPAIGGTIAAASLACELAKATGVLDEATVGKCRLPKRVTQITRQNVSVAVLDPLTLFQEGRTGLPEVDMWVASIVAGRARRRATIFPMGRRGGRSRRPG